MDQSCIDETRHAFALLVDAIAFLNLVGNVGVNVSERGVPCTRGNSNSQALP